MALISQYLQSLPVDTSPVRTDDTLPNHIIMRVKDLPACDNLSSSNSSYSDEGG